MKIDATDLSDVLLITPSIHTDNRGFFCESFNEEKFFKLTGINFRPVQDNQSYSKQGTLRGIHFQTNPMQQAKLVHVIEGEIFDIAVDLRRESPSYCKWVGKYLSSENHRQLYIPEGFGHAFLVTSEEARVMYKVNNYYSPKHECSIKYDDPKLDIKWPDMKFHLSDKDAQADYLHDESNFF
ncbi:MAG: dTDP-4-dehydrorhamnose 3,5-epimerase [Gammaproteobacteria bacterium]